MAPRKALYQDSHPPHEVSLSCVSPNKELTRGTVCTSMRGPLIRLARVIGTGQSPWLAAPSPDRSIRIVVFTQAPWARPRHQALVQRGTQYRIMISRSALATMPSRQYWGFINQSPSVAIVPNSTARCAHCRVTEKWYLVEFRGT